MLKDKPTPRLQIDSCEALFEKLKWEMTQLEKDWSSSYSTFNFVITAHHLYQDWIKNAGTTAQQQRKAELSENGKLLFKIWRDVTNATKHWELDEQNQKRQVVSEITEPEIRDWYAFLYAGPVIYVRVGEALPSLPELTGITISCFTWLLDGEQSDFEKNLETVFLPLK